MRRLFGKWHLHICASGAVLNIFMMMTANLIGFAVGVDGMKEMMGQLFRLDGIFESHLRIMVLLVHLDRSVYGCSLHVLGSCQSIKEQEQDFLNIYVFPFGDKINQIPIKNILVLILFTCK